MWRVTAVTVRGEFAVHDPGGEVDAVAAEVEESAAAVLFGVGEPGEELGADADFFGALMAVVDDELAEVADLARGEEVGCFGVGGVPGGLVVGEDGDFIFFGEVLDGEGVFDGGGEGFSTMTAMWSGAACSMAARWSAMEV